MVFSRLLVILILLITSNCNLLAQNTRLEVFSAFGGEFTNSKYQIAYTIGEVVTETQGNRYYFANQGFHQADWKLVFVWEYEEAAVSIDVFPNPFLNTLTINLPDVLNQEKYRFYVYDFSMKIVAKGDLNQVQNTITLDQLQAGGYLLNITNEQSLIKTYRIIKSH